MRLSAFPLSPRIYACSTSVAKFHRHAWVAGFAVGPFAAYLLWAMQRGKRGHIGAAILFNIGLWILGPILIGVTLSWLR